MSWYSALYPKTEDKYVGIEIEFFYPENYDKLTELCRQNKLKGYMLNCLKMVQFAQSMDKLLVK